MKFPTHAALALAIFALSSTCSAHIVLDQRSAPASSYYRGLFKVGHGCDGAATTSIAVRIPEGVRNVKPQPKVGWTLERKLEKLATPYTSHGKEVTERVSEIVWRGGPLADEHYDEFIVQMQLPESPGALWFKVLQRCEKGETDWAEIPAQGLSTRGLKSPAALLEVTPNAPTATRAADGHRH